MNGVGKVDVTKSIGYVCVSYNSYKFLSKSYRRANL
jgi:hypothetical protein